VEALRKMVREQIERDYTAAARLRLKRQLLDKLAESYSFPVPPGMVEIELNNILQQYEAEKNYAAGQVAGDEAAQATGDEAAQATGDAAAEPAVEPQAATEDDEKTKAEFQTLAERRVRLGLLLAEVGRNANITVTQDELNQALIREAQRFPGAERRVLDYYRKNPEAAGNLRAPIFEEKVVDYIVELAKPSERKVGPQELLAMTEAEDAADEAGGSAATEQVAPA